MECIEKEAADDSLLTEKLVGLTTDGASVMVSARGDLYGKLKQAVNSKLFLTHCPPHRLILASKAGQKVLPASKVMYDYIYKIVDSIEKRFPEIDFMFTNTAFLEPPLRNLQQPDMQAMLNRFGQESGPVTFPLDRVIMQFRLYQNDSSIDIQFSACNKE